MESIMDNQGLSVSPGDIVTRSDGMSFLLGDFSTAFKVLEGIRLDVVKELPLSYKSAQYLIGKRVGDYFYEYGRGDFTITIIKKTGLTSFYKEKEQEERMKNEQEMAKDAALAKIEADRVAKIREVKEWFAKNIRMDGKFIKLDDEQAEAVANTNKNSLVAARAGSGKTSTLVAKIVYLVAKHQIPQDKLIAFVFNNDASKEINDRLSKITMNDRRIFYNPVVATTFHAFAKHVIYTHCGEAEKYGKILCDGKEGDFRSLYIQEIIKRMPKRKNIRILP